MSGPQTEARQRWVQGYNAQAVVTEDQIIVAAAVTQDRNGVQQLKPTLALAWANLAFMEEEPEIGVALADAGYWSEANDGTATVDCELIIATRKEWKPLQAMREQAAPQGRIPKGLSARERMERKLLTKRGKALLYKKRGQTVDPVFGQMKETQGADGFQMRSRSCATGSGSSTQPRTISKNCTRSASIWGKTRSNGSSDGGVPAFSGVMPGRRGCRSETDSEPVRMIRKGQMAFGDGMSPSQQFYALAA